MQFKTRNVKSIKLALFPSFKNKWIAIIWVEDYKKKSKNKY